MENMDKELVLKIEDIKSVVNDQTNEKEKEKCPPNQVYEITLSQYELDMIEWRKHVDRGYAWVIMAALWLLLFSLFATFRLYGLIFAHTTQLGIYTREEASFPIATFLTVDNMFGLVAPLIASRISVQKCIAIGGILIVASNIMAVFSQSLMVDILLLGVVMGLGVGLVIFNTMSIVNSYFVRYRAMVFGIVFTGASLNMVVLAPVMEWVLDHCPWRYAYLTTGLVSAPVILTSFLLKPNLKPELPPAEKSAQVFVPSFTEKVKQPDDGQTVQESATGRRESQTLSYMTNCKSILKTPAFHLIWFQEMVYFWAYSIFCLVMIDYGFTERGCSEEEADSLIMVQAVSEIIGRIVPAILIDRKLISVKRAAIFTMLAQSVLLTAITQITGYLWMASLTFALFITISFSFILLNNLMVDHIGESRVTQTYGMASFISGILMFVRPIAIGYFKDLHGSYDHLMIYMSLFSALVAMLWIIEPLITRVFTGRNDSLSVK